MLRIWFTAFLLTVIVGTAHSAPPEPYDTLESGSLDSPVEDVSPVFEEEFENSRDEYDATHDFEGKKFIEIRIDNDGIRAIDEYGEEFILDEKSDAYDWDEKEHGKSYSDGDQGVVEFGSIYIKYDDEIEGDVVAIRGNVTVDGYVNGNIFSTKTVHLGPEAVVTGDIVAKRLKKDPGAELQGQFKKFDIGDFPFRYSQRIGLPGFEPWIAVTIVIMVFSLLFMVIFQRPVKRIKYHLEHGFLKNFIVGLLLVLAIPPVFILLCITIVGIPVAVFIYPFALLGAVILGSIGAAYYVGILVGCWTNNLKFDSTFLTTLIGVIAIMASWLLSGFFNLVGSEGFTTFFFVIGIIVVSVSGLAGLGSVWFSRFGVRPKAVGWHDEVSTPTESDKPGGQQGSITSPGTAQEE